MVSWLLVASVVAIVAMMAALLRSGRRHEAARDAAHQCLADAGRELPPGALRVAARLGLCACQLRLVTTDDRQWVVLAFVEPMLLAAGASTRDGAVRFAGPSDTLDPQLVALLDEGDLAAVDGALDQSLLEDLAERREQASRPGDLLGLAFGAGARRAVSFGARTGRDHAEVAGWLIWATLTPWMLVAAVLAANRLPLLSVAILAVVALFHAQLRVTGVLSEVRRRVGLGWRRSLLHAHADAPARVFLSISVMCLVLYGVLAVLVVAAGGSGVWVSLLGAGLVADRAVTELAERAAWLVDHGDEVRSGTFEPAPSRSR